MGLEGTCFSFKKLMVLKFVTKLTAEYGIWIYFWFHVFGNNCDRCKRTGQQLFSNILALFVLWLSISVIDLPKLQTLTTEWFRGQLVLRLILLDDGIDKTWPFLFVRISNVLLSTVGKNRDQTLGFHIRFAFCPKVCSENLGKV